MSNNDCLLNSIVYCQLNGAINCLLICKEFTVLDNEYFWKLRKINEYTNQKIINQQFCLDYKLYHDLNKIKNKTYPIVSLYKSYVRNKIYFLLATFNSNTSRAIIEYTAT